MSEKAFEAMGILRQDLIKEIVKLESDIFYALVEDKLSPWLSLSLTREQLRILFLLYLRGELTPGKVASTLNVPRANVTGPIDRLVALNMLSRIQDPNDRRSYVLRLTREGRAQVAQFREWAIGRMEEFLDRMGEEDLLILCRGLRALKQAASSRAGVESIKV